MTKSTIGAGGYKTLDLSAYGPFTPQTPVPVPGVYDAVIATNTDKPTLVSGLVVGSTTIPAFFANFDYDMAQKAWSCKTGAQNHTFNIYPNNTVSVGGY